jgi:catechol 2,3-dioxygenase-like lactoylglutathione lyase family enzyme
MRITGLDHLTLTVSDVPSTCTFYQRVLGMEPREERRGKWSLHFGDHKISLQDVHTLPIIARDMTPGMGNFCVLTETPVADVAAHLKREGIAIVDGPAERAGAVGMLLSIYFKDPDGNLVEVSNRL